MQLSDAACRNAKFTGSPKKLADGGGLYLLINATGKYWRWDYRFAGKRKTMALGVYPEVPLAGRWVDEAKRKVKDETGYLRGARDLHEDGRRLLAAGHDPMVHRLQARIAAAQAGAQTFESVAREWHKKFKTKWAESTADKILSQLETHIFPWVGKRPVSEVTPPELLVCLRRIESAGALETAHRVKQNCGRVFRYAVSTGRAERDPAADLTGSLPPVKVTHHAALTEPEGIGDLLRAIEKFSGTFVVKCALRLAPHLFVRPGELRQAEWAEFDLDAATWLIPAGRMKMRREHLVPLSTQAVAILRELHPLTGHGRLVFPGVRDHDRPMSENTLNAALRRMGYAHDEIVSHGFRAIASTRLNEMGWSEKVVDRQLAHVERNKVRRTYDRSELLADRIRMMQAWSDYLDGLRADTEDKVVALRRPAA